MHETRPEAEAEDEVEGDGGGEDEGEGCHTLNDTCLFYYHIVWSTLFYV
jgi:hypothetical protein